MFATLSCVNPRLVQASVASDCISLLPPACCIHCPPRPVLQSPHCPALSTVPCSLVTLLHPLCFLLSTPPCSSVATRPALFSVPAPARRAAWPRVGPPARSPRSYRLPLTTPPCPSVTPPSPPRPVLSSSRSPSPAGRLAPRRPTSPLAKKFRKEMRMRERRRARDKQSTKRDRRAGGRYRSASYSPAVRSYSRSPPPASAAVARPDRRDKDGYRARDAGREGGARSKKKHGGRRHRSRDRYRR